jgi:endonuclease/exonuclease/phosphatase family metal-dependent hydrolase
VPETAQPANGVPPFTVLTVNVHKGFTLFNRRFILPELRDAVRSVGADIVFLQEVQGSHSGHASRFIGWPEVPQYEFLADTMWTDFAYGRNAVYPAGHHGNAVLSKFPITRHQNRDVTVLGKEKRGLLHCELDVPGYPRVIHAICVHLGLRESQRRSQIELLCDLIDHEVPADAPLVVAGDFNDWRERGHPQLLRCSGLVEAFHSTSGQFARTFPARLPLLPLDRIYVRNLMIEKPLVLSMRPWSHLSDHAALAADLRPLEASR